MMVKAAKAQGARYHEQHEALAQAAAAKKSQPEYEYLMKVVNQRKT